MTARQVPVPAFGITLEEHAELVAAKGGRPLTQAPIQRRADIDETPPPGTSLVDNYLNHHRKQGQ
jgi:hypothetical protein